MEMFRSFRGDKHEFCLAVIKFKHVRSCPSFDITRQSMKTKSICKNQWQKISIYQQTAVNKALSKQALYTALYTRALKWQTIMM